MSSLASGSALVLIAGLSTAIAGIATMAWTDLIAVGLTLLVIGAAVSTLGVRSLALVETDAAPIGEVGGRAFLRGSVGFASAGLVSLWLALTAYPGVPLKVGGIAAGGGFLYAAAVFASGWYRARLQTRK